MEETEALADAQEETRELRIELGEFEAQVAGLNAALKTVNEQLNALDDEGVGLGRREGEVGV